MRLSEKCAPAEAKPSVFEGWLLKPAPLSLPSPWKALSAPKPPKGTQERSKRPPERAKKRLQERLGALLRRFGPKMMIDSGNADFVKSMLSPRREHRFWGSESPKMEPRMHLERSCEAKRAEEERKSA